MTVAPRLSLSVRTLVAIAAAGCTAVLLGVAIAAAPVQMGGLTLGVILIVAVALHPPTAVYSLLFLTPLLAGIDRGAVLPLLRPYEALLLLGWVGLFARALAVRDAAVFSLRIQRVDLAVAAFVFCGSAIPLALMVARGRDVSADDVLYALQLWKYLATYLLVRLAIRNRREAAGALAAALASAAIVAVLAILQSNDIAGVDQLLARYFAPLGETDYVTGGRGTSTLGSSIAAADVMVYSLAIAAAWLVAGGPRPVLVPLAALLLLGSISSGQFSGAIGLVVMVLALGAVTRRIGRTILLFAPFAFVGGMILRAVIEARITEFGAGRLPPSWEARLDNLQTHFWPRLGEDWNWITGVQIEARVPSPKPWEHFVWIESGYTWLLWSGGILFLLAFLWYLWTALATTWRTTRSRRDEIAVAAAAGFAVLVTIGLLMVLDPHLTMRGSAELSFSLVAIAVAGSASRSVGRRSAPRLGGPR
jgi:hypothetical protein